MKYHLCVGLAFLVFSTFPNHGSKSSERRAAGLVPYPRIGRHLAMASFARSDGSAGLVNFPRVGRSGFATSAGNRAEYEPETPRIDEDREIDFLDYLDFSESKNRLNNPRLGSPRPEDDVRDESRGKSRCDRRLDAPWALLFATRDFPNLNQQPTINNLMSRAIRDPDRRATTSTTDNASM